MGIKGIGRVTVQGVARTRFISVPAVVAGDSAFPFSDGEEVLIEIDGDGLRVTRIVPAGGEAGRPH